MSYFDGPASEWKFAGEIQHCNLVFNEYLWTRGLYVSLS